jgi:hypothetical protein
VRRLLLPLFALASGAVALAPPSVEAACLAPTITVQPTSGAPGAGFAIHGEDFGTDCNDVNPQPGEPPLGEPAQGILLTLVDAAGAEHALATVDAADDYTVDVDAEVPDAAAGAGRVDAVVQEGGFGATAPFAVLGEGTEDCERPTLFVEPAAGPAGAPIEVRGENFGTFCNDINPQPGDPPLGDPQHDVEIRFVAADGTTTVLGVVDAGPGYRFTLDATVPADAVVGSAAIEAGGSGAFDIAFEVTAGVIPAEPAFTG